ncbi:hypothetical protein D3C81_1860580 [compost metagenome]
MNSITRSVGTINHKGFCAQVPLFLFYSADNVTFGYPGCRKNHLITGDQSIERQNGVNLNSHVAAAPPFFLRQYSVLWRIAFRLAEIDQLGLHISAQQTHRTGRYDPFRRAHQGIHDVGFTTW